MAFKKERSIVHFYETLRASGITFAIDGQGNISISGETGISPLLVQLVNERADALRPLIEGNEKGPVGEAGADSTGKG